MIYKTTAYIIQKIGGIPIVFTSQKDAADFLKVDQSALSHCAVDGTKCRGYTVTKAMSEADLYSDRRLHKIWESMNERCNYEKHPHFESYGGRGITVCDKWKTYLPFAKWAFANGYAPSLTIDRIDNNGNYEPKNCRWISVRAQQNNKRSNHTIEFMGETHTISEWSEKTGIKYTTLKERIKCGWSAEKALTTDVRKRSCGADMRGGHGN